MRAWERWVAAGWAALLVLALVKHAAAPNRGSVWPIYAEGSRELWAGSPARSLNACQHLPYFADLVAPFAALPDRLGAPLWFVFTTTVFLTGVRAFLRAFAPPEWSRRQHVLVWNALPWVGLGSLVNNQTNPLIAGLWAWACVLLKARPAVAGVLVALTAFKLYPVVLGCVLAPLAPRRFTLALVLGVLGLLAWPFLFHPAERVWERYTLMWVYLSSGLHASTYDYVGLREALGRWGLPLSPGTFAPFAAAAGVAVGLRAWRSSGERVRHALALGALWCVTFGPSVEPQTFLLASLPASMLLADALGPSGRPRLGFWAALAAVMVVGPLQNEILGPAVWRAVVGSKAAAAGALVLLGLAWAAAGRAGSGGGLGESPCRAGPGAA